MLEIKICEWGDNRLRLILAPIDSVYNAMQKPINDYFRPFDVTNIFIILILNFTQVLINHFHFVINKNNSQLNALINLNDSCLSFFVDFIHIWSWHPMGVWSQLFSDCLYVLLMDPNQIQFKMSNLQDRETIRSSGQHS